MVLCYYPSWHACICKAMLFMPDQTFDSQLTFSNSRQEPSSLRNSSFLITEYGYSLWKKICLLGRSWVKQIQFLTQRQYPAVSYSTVSIGQCSGIRPGSGIEHLADQGGRGLWSCFHPQLTAQSNLFVQQHLLSNHHLPGLQGGVKLEFHWSLFLPSGLQLSRELGLQAKTQTASTATPWRKMWRGFWVKYQGDPDKWL